MNSDRRDSNLSIGPPLIILGLSANQFNHRARGTDTRVYKQEYMGCAGGGPTTPRVRARATEDREVDAEVPFSVPNSTYAQQVLPF